MANRQARASESSDIQTLPRTPEALVNAVDALEDSANRMSHSAHALRQMLSGTVQLPTVTGPPLVAAEAAEISTWEDDPYGEGIPGDSGTPNTAQVAVGTNTNPLLQMSIEEPRPPIGLYAPGSPEFRYWVAVEALTRGVNFWTACLPAGTRWTTLQDPMRVTLVTGRDLNANYSRRFGLRFYEQTVRGRQIFSGESPDVTCHELGHAILDALRPELFDAASAEVAAFHESFGDMSAILSAVQVESLSEKVIRETEGHLNVNSRLSRLAEQLGWAIRQISPESVGADSLRNAANKFFYQDPDTLPPAAPANQLSSESHSFSRVFTGAFLDALARMLDTVGRATPRNLRTAGGHLGQLLVDGVHLAPITSGYFSEVAAAMIQADQTRFQGRYRSALSSAFIQHGILAPSAAVALKDAPVPRAQGGGNGAAGDGSHAVAARGPMLLTLGGESDGYRRAAADAPELPTRSLATQFGLTLEVHAPAETSRFGAASAVVGVARTQARKPEDEALAYVEDLIQLGKIDFEPARSLVGPELSAPDPRAASKATHTLLVVGEDKARLKRLHFNCGCGCRVRQSG
jgi:hypothetical protein